MKRITHPSPNEAADFYKHLNALWPALCRAVLAVTYAPRNGKGPVLDGAGGGEIARACAQDENARDLGGLRASQVARDTGFEPVAFGSGGRRSIQLS